MVGFADHLAPPDLRIIGSRRTVSGDASYSLRGLGTAKMPDGAIVYVQSQKSYWQLDREDTQTPDNVSIVAALQGNGNWLRLQWGFVNGSAWLDQATWYIDAVNGSDDNLGDTAARALATHAEFAARMGPCPLITQAITVHILSDLNETIEMCADFAGAGSSIQYLGTVLEVLATDTVAAAQSATAQEGQLTGTLIVDFTPYIGYRVLYTSGAQSGFSTWITGISQAAVGTEIARIGNGTMRVANNNQRPDWVTTAAVPAPGDAFRIQRQPTVKQIAVKSRRLDGGGGGLSNTLGFVFSFINVTQNIGETRSSVINDARIPSEDGAALFVGCAIYHTMTGSGGVQMNGCMPGLEGAPDRLAIHNLAVSMYGSCGGALDFYNSVVWNMSTGCYADTGRVNFYSGSTGYVINLGVYHGNSEPGVFVEHDVTISRLETLWGNLTLNNANADGIVVYGRVFYSSGGGLTMTVQALASEVELGHVGGQSLAFAALPGQNTIGGGQNDDAIMGQY